jgi:RNase H-fold protein (predicted Holliday junction resolvase)
MSEETCVLALDPGAAKCGIAVVRRGKKGFDTLYHEVAQRDAVKSLLPILFSRHSPEAIVIGNGTTSRDLVRVVERLGLAPIQLVDERFTTLRARKLYFQHNPPRGILRLIPTTMRVPNRPYDDYVAIILAQSYLSTL